MKTLFIAVCFLLLVSLSVPVFAQEGEAEGTLDAAAMGNEFLGAFNQILVEEFEARALARNSALDGVAEEIARSVGCNEERVEFDIQQSVKDAGYAAYPGETFPRTTRIPLLPVVNNRPIEEMAQFYAADIFENNINQPGRFYREIGIGIVPCVVVEADQVGSTQQYGLFIILGSQPDVIPVVVGDGSGSVEGSAPTTVAVSVHQESTRQMDGIFGRGASIRISTAPLGDSDEAIAYGSPIEVELTECGTNTVHYELTDTNDVVLEGSADIELVCPE